MYIAEITFEIYLYGSLVKFAFSHIYGIKKTNQIIKLALLAAACHIDLNIDYPGANVIGKDVIWSAIWHYVL